MKDTKKIIFVMILVGILTSMVTAYATTYLYNANEVSYDNTNSNISSTNVQNAITELYDAAQDYSSMNTRVTGLEGYLHNYGTENWIRTGVGFAGNKGFKISSNGVDRSFLYFDVTNDRTVLEGRSSTLSLGSINISGNPVMINGTDISSNVSPNYFFRKTSATSNINTLTISYPYSSYRYFNGILFTRYSMFYINIKDDNSSSTPLSVKVTQLGNDGTTETITPTVSGNNVILKSSYGWNDFYLMGIDKTGTNNITLSGSLT